MRRSPCWCRRGAAWRHAPSSPPWHEDPLWLPAGLHGLRGIQLLRVPPQAHICGSNAAALPSLRTVWVMVNAITTLPSRAAEALMTLIIGADRLIREDSSSLQIALAAPGVLLWHEEPDRAVAP